MLPSKMKMKDDEMNPEQASFIADTSKTDALAVLVWDAFDKSERERKPFEQQWMQDLNQYEGRYEEDVQKALDEDPNMCSAFIRLTRSKIRAMDARMSDMLFPAGSAEKFWSIKTTPIPELDEPTKQRVIQRFVEMAVMEAQQEAGQPLPPEQLQMIGQQVQVQIAEDEALIEEAFKTAADDRVENMRKLMHDQLSESKYVQENIKVIHSGNLYGTGILKGPMTEAKQIEHWIQDPQTGQHGMVHVNEYRPFYESADIWDIYPDMDTSDPDDGEFIIHRHLMPRSKVSRLRRQPGFDKERISEYLKTFRKGDADRKWHEQARNKSASNQTEQYEVLEYWGMVPGEQLADAGLEIPEEDWHEDFEANIWVLGNQVIKVQLNPTEQQSRPFKFFYFEEVEGTIFGRGISEIMRDTQSIFNAALRMMIDNAARASGPVVEYDVELVGHIDKIKPWMAIPRGRSDDPSRKGIWVHTFPSMMNELMAIMNMTKELGDEVTTLPAFMAGETNNLSGAGDTASGLSMMMGAAQITVKDVINNFDQGVTKPAIRDLYHYNMQFSDDESIKGDMEVLPEGSRTLVAKEITIQQTKETLQMSANPEDKIYVNRHKLWEHLQRDSALPADVVRDEQEVDMIQGLQSELQQLKDMMVQFELMDPNTGQLSQKAQSIMQAQAMAA